MSKRVRRPSIFLLAALWAGLLTGGSAGSQAWVFMSCLAPPVTCLLCMKNPRIGLGLMMACLFLLGILRSPDSLWNTADSRVEAAWPARFPVVLKVTPTTLSSLSTAASKARVTEVIAGYESLRGKVVLLDSEAGVVEGTKIAGTFRKPGRPLNPFSVDMRALSRRRGYAGRISAGPRERTERPGAASMLGTLRTRITRLIRKASSGECSGVLEAMLLGKRSDLSPATRSLMIRAGVYHVLAISGLHVGIVVMLVVSFISILRLPRGPRMAMAVACVVLYVILTGARPSALRAGMFFVLLSLCRLLEWRVDYPNCVCAAGTLLLLAFPYLAWDLGFKLSLGAVFGITLLVPQLHPRRRVRSSRAGKLLQYSTLGVAASFSAQAFTLPVVLYHFGRISLAGVATNLIVLPLTTLIVAAGLEASLAALLWDRLALVFMRAAATLVNAVLASMSFVTTLVDPLVVAGRPGTWKVLVYYGVLAYLGLAAPRMRRGLKVLLLLGAYAFMLISVPFQARDDLTVTFVHVGDGDACLVETPSGRTMLVDTGPCSMDFDAASFYLIPFLSLKGISRLDAIVITHSHNDHYGGLGTLAENLEIGEIIVGDATGEPAYENALDEAVALGIPLREVRRGDSLTLGRAVLDFLHPSAEWLSEVADPNAESIVFTLKFGSVCFLFTGDVTPEVQAELAELDLVTGCDVLKVPHHGAPNGLDRRFLGALGADYAVIPVGSRFPSHPSRETIEMLERSGARVFTTISDGAVTVRTDGESLKVWCRAGN